MSWPRSFIPGRSSSTELVTAALERIEAAAADLNAFVHVDPDGALEAAAGIDRNDPRPFAGVPIAIKDTAAVAGMPYTLGSDLFGDFVPGARRVRRAARCATPGFVIVGKTNMPEFGILPVTEPRRFGPARNPWDTDRTPGGSPAAPPLPWRRRHGPARPRQRRRRLDPDPAVCCGLVGPEADAAAASRAGPTRATTSSSRTASLTRTVAETAQMLDVLGGYEIGEPTWAPLLQSRSWPRRRASRPAADRLHARRRDGGAARRRVRAGPPATPRSSCRAGPRGGGDRGALGRARSCFDAFIMAFGTPISMGMFFGGMVTGREPSQELVEPLSWTIWKRGPRAHARWTTCSARTQLRRCPGHRRAMGDLRRDAQPRLWPGARCGSARSTHAATTRGTTSARSQFTPYTAIFNVTGQPAISLPLFHGEDGLPTGDAARRPSSRRGGPAQPRRAAGGRAALGGPPARAGRGLAALGPERTLLLELLLVLAARVRAGRRRLRALPVHVLPQDLVEVALRHAVGGVQRQPLREAGVGRWRSCSSR